MHAILHKNVLHWTDKNKHAVKHKAGVLTFRS